MVEIVLVRECKLKLLLCKLLIEAILWRYMPLSITATFYAYAGGRLTCDMMTTVGIEPSERTICLATCVYVTFSDELVDIMVRRSNILCH